MILLPAKKLLPMKINGSSAERTSGAEEMRVRQKELVREQSIASHHLHFDKTRIEIQLPSAQSSQCAGQMQNDRILRIQNGWPRLAEIARKKVKFEPLRASGPLNVPSLTQNIQSA